MIANVINKHNPAGAVQLALPGQQAPSPEGRRSDTKCATTWGALVVLDTNIILDAFVFNDQTSEPIRQGLAANSLKWIASQAMRDELARVLAYPKIVRRLNFYQLTSGAVLNQFDLYAQLIEPAPKASLTCQDADDQKFIDLAVQHKALLISKDQHILSMRKRLLAHGTRAQAAL